MLGLEGLGEELAHLRLPQRPRDTVDPHLDPRSQLLCLDVVLCSEPPGAFRDYVIYLGLEFLGGQSFSVRFFRSVLLQGRDVLSS